MSFRKIQKADVPVLSRIYHDENAVGCEYNAVSAYLWSSEYDLRIAEYGESVIKAYYRGDGSVWGYCLPRGGNTAEAVEAVLRHAAEQGGNAAFDYLSRYERDALEQLFPNRFTYYPREDAQDYIYETEALATLPGKKYHAKRNHVSKFYRTYSDSEIKPINADTAPDALKVVCRWYSERGIDFSEYGEYGVIRDALNGLEEFDMKGAVLYVGDTPVAMTLGSEISPLCFDVMFEKALRDYEGSYAVINMEFAKTLTDYRYLNREEDMGIEGLRKAKLSYHPAIIYDRFRAELKP